MDGRSYWFAGYFNPFDRERMVRYAGQARADRFKESFDGKLPFVDAKIVRVFDPDPAAAKQFSETFSVPVARLLDEFADGLDGVIVPFPSGGPARDYAAVAPLVERGIPLFLDRIILEQSESLRKLCERALQRNAPLQVTSFPRYFAELLLPDRGASLLSAIVSTPGDPVGYGADLINLLDELMQCRAVSVTNIGDPEKDVLRIRYQDGRHALLQLFHHAKFPQHVTAFGDGWSRSLQFDGTQNHFAAMRQFEAFLRSLDTRQPPVPYDRVFANAALLHAAERREFGSEIALGQY